MWNLVLVYTQRTGVRFRTMLAVHCCDVARLLSALRVTRRPCRTGGMTVHVRLSAEVSNHLSAEVGADISAYTGLIIAQVSADLGDDASADAGGNITHT